jgi:hypothetical protein
MSTQNYIVQFNSGNIVLSVEVKAVSEESAIEKLWSDPPTMLFIRSHELELSHVEAY